MPDQTGADLPKTTPEIEVKSGPQILQNLTAKRLRILGNNGHILVLAPFEKERQLSEAEQDLFPQLDRFEMQNFVKRSSVRQLGDFGTQFKVLLQGAGMVTGVLTFMVYTFVTKEKEVDPRLVNWILFGGGALFLIILAVGVLVLLLSRKRDQRELVQSTTRGLAQVLSLMLILVLGIGFPSLAFYFLGGGREVFSSQSSLAKLGFTLQHIFFVTASLLPALLYFLFDRQQLGTLRQRFEQQIFRLDPTIESLVDVRAKYGRQIDEIYGRESTSGEARLVRNTRWPILVATLVITLGWMLTLSPAGPGLEIVRPTQLIDFFIPQRTAVTFGFLGAYFFILNNVLHRYVRADLKPKAYSSITVRIFIVTILAWVIPMPSGAGNSWALMIPFMIGVFPESGVTLIRESIRNQTTPLIRFLPFFPSTKEKYPLTELEELDVYDRARLLDEGVTNIESLAHHDLIDLMLETRIPVPRLVDWIDQSILYLHLESDAGDKEQDTDNGSNREATTNSLATAEMRSLRTWLRGNFVRTATDFMAAYNHGKGPLNHNLSAEKRHQLRVLSETLKDDEWLGYIRHWRKCTYVVLKELDASATAKEQTDSAAHVEQSAGPKVTVISQKSDSQVAHIGGV